MRDGQQHDGTRRLTGNIIIILYDKMKCRNTLLLLASSFCLMGSVKSFTSLIYALNGGRVEKKMPNCAPKYMHGIEESEVSDCCECTFQKEVTQFLDHHEIRWNQMSHCGRNFIAIHKPTLHNSEEHIEENIFLGVHLLPTPNSIETCVNPNLCKKITDTLAEAPFQNVVHLHQDVWNNKNKITKARLLAKNNIVTNKWFARNTIVERIPIQVAMNFLEENHLWGATRAKFNYGIFLKEKVVSPDNDTQTKHLLAVATFSPRRHVSRHGGNRMYRSHELIRYCAKKDEVVLGGITKALAQFCREVAPDDIVTCIDRDFGDGEGWAKIGFERVSVMPPLVMAVETATCDHGTRTFSRKYMVGAGVGVEPSHDKNLSRKGRPSIDYATFIELDTTHDYSKALMVLKEHRLYPVFDSGVERRMLIVKRTKLERHAVFRREEMGLVDLDIPDNRSTKDIWNNSTPSFPNRYYSNNHGIESLLQRAASR